MKVTRQVESFIRGKVETKVAEPSVVQDYADASNAIQQFEKELTDKLDSVAQMEFTEFVKNHPELAGAELIVTTYSRRYNVAWNNSTVRTEYDEATKLRAEYVYEVAQRVCIDASKCKDTKEILELIDKVVSNK